jgi:hypothetical protein
MLARFVSSSWRAKTRIRGTYVETHTANCATVIVRAEIAPIVPKTHGARSAKYESVSYLGAAPRPSTDLRAGRPPRS